MNKSLKSKEKNPLAQNLMGLWQPHLGDCSLTDGKGGAEFYINRAEMLSK